MSWAVIFPDWDTARAGWPGADTAFKSLVLNIQQQQGGNVPQKLLLLNPMARSRGLWRCFTGQCLSWAALATKVQPSEFFLRPSTIFTFLILATPWSNRWRRHVSEVHKVHGSHTQLSRRARLSPRATCATPNMT